ncbi:MAG TPA: cyclic-phosphate processing receiver domain-containing protein [Pyrinomonadaceae bacterium]|nr:cyclic-phosphate processing receiver domain-containing protein [Pyrinomonadaceae bacterium]
MARDDGRTRALGSRMSILSGLLHKIGLGNGAGEQHPARVFLLDDDTLRHEWFAKQFKGHQLDVAMEPARAVELLSTNYYDLIFLDHDLLPEHYYAEEFDDERSGYAVARWLAATPTRHAAANIIVHTRNADGALRMVELLRSVGRQAEHVPFHLLAPKIKQLRRGR